MQSKCCFVWMTPPRARHPKAAGNGICPFVPWKAAFWPSSCQNLPLPFIRTCWLLKKRTRSLRSTCKTSSSFSAQEAMIRAYAGMMEGRRNQLRLLSEELANTRDLVKEGYAPRNRQLELERMVADVNFALTELAGSNTRAMRSVAEMRQRAIQRRQEFRKEIDSNLADVSREAQSESARLAAATDELQRTVIKAPAGGQVVGLAVQSPGSVIGPGFKLMDIVPPDEALLLEAQVPAQMIDRIHTGMNVDIRFSGFSHTPQLVVQGKVLSVSKDLLAVPQSNLTYYLARVTVTPDGMKQLGKRQLQPGMGAEVIFVTGERSLLTYLLGPLTKRIAASLKEE